MNMKIKIMLKSHMHNYLHMLSGNLKAKVSTMSTCDEGMEVLENLFHSCKQSCGSVSKRKFCINDCVCNQLAILKPNAKMQNR